jgi:hypothetical protein
MRTEEEAVTLMIRTTKAAFTRSRTLSRRFIPIHPSIFS